jgi:flagellar hook-associated protein 2
MKVEEDGGTVARDLNLLGEATDGQIDGSFEFKLAISGSETLTSLAARIGSETTLATATLLNDGTQLAPYRLSIASQTSGKAGELIIDDGDSGLGVSTLVAASDARLLFGGNSAGGMLLTSSTNTFAGAIDGLTITASAVDDRPVTVTINRDLDGLVAAVRGLVTDFNSAIDAVREAGAYDAENETPGVLQGEGSLYTLQSRLQGLVNNTVFASGPFTRLLQVGVTTESQGHLAFDEEEFRAAYATNPEALERFFTDEDFGIAVQIKTQIEQMTGADGLIPRATETMTTQTDLLQARVTGLNEQLDRKRARLLRQFQAMEVALSQLQSQSAALSSLSLLAESYGTSNSGSNS